MESSPYAHLLEKTRLPHPSFQRLAVVSIFQKLSSAPPRLGGFDSDPGRDALSRCLTSPSPAVVDQAVRELCRYVNAGGPLDVSRGLIELQSALDGCDPDFVTVIVKGVGFLCRVAFRNDPSWGRKYSHSPEFHPFVKVLSCRTELASAELTQQVLLFILHNIRAGIPAVSEFIRPFLMFCILKIPSSAHMSSFTKDLISSIASLSCSFPEEAIPTIRLLMGCLKFFPHRNEQEFKYLLSCAEYLVDAVTVVLKLLIGTEKLRSEAEACSMELLENLLSICVDLHKPHKGCDFAVELSRRLLVAHKELGLKYLPDFVSVMLSSSLILIRVEFEHEQLSVLKLLAYLIEWKNETCKSRGDTSYFMEEFLLVFPVMNLLSSPSKSVKASATYLLSVLERLLLDLLVAQKEVKFFQAGVAFTSKPESIVSRLLCCLWSQEKSPLSSFYFLELTSQQSSVAVRRDTKITPWISQLREYSLSTAERLKSMPISQSQEKLFSGISLLLSTVASILVAHPRIGGCTVDSFAAVGLMDPKVSMPLLLTFLFYSKIFCSSGSNSQEVLLKLLEMLSSLASHSAIGPLVVQTILPMLHKDVKPVLYATVVRLLCKTWKVADQCFGSLQEILDPKMLAEFTSQRDICVSLASSICDACKHDPDRGVDLILSISSCIESRDSSVQALGLESLAHLCEADVVDFYTAWNIISKNLLDYTVEPVVAYSLCILLRWGAMDVEAYAEYSKSIMNILWEVGTSRNTHCGSLWLTARSRAFESLVHYQVGHVQKNIHNFKERNMELLISEDNTEVLKALEQFEINILNFEHLTRRRLHKGKRSTVHKVEKLLDLFPQAIFPSGEQHNYARELPGAVLLSLVFTPKEFQCRGTSKELAKLNAVYENKLLEIAQSLHLSRNIFFALLALQSWKAFISRWMRAISVLLGSMSSFQDGSSKGAHDILEIMCKAAEGSTPRVAENLALAIGALCMVLRPSEHLVSSAASNFLLKWLLQSEHEHRQWSAAISLGILSNYLNTTDRTQKYKIITGLLKILGNGESYLVKGACGVGLGFACQDLLARMEVQDDSSFGRTTRRTEAIMLGKIIQSLSSAISSVCQSSSDSLKSLSEHFPIAAEDRGTEETTYSSCGSPEDMEGDVWGVAGLVLGLGNSIVAVYRCGAYDAVLKIKNILISWLPFSNSSIQNSPLCTEMSEIALSVGSCIAWPTVFAFCQRAELTNYDTDGHFSAYSTLISELISIKKSGSFHQALLMASCIGAGSLLSFILNDGVQSLKIDDVKGILEVMRSTYYHPFPPAVHFSGMLGVVNALGAEAGFPINTFPQAISLESNCVQKDSSYVCGPMILSHVLEPLCTSIIQEMFMLAKDSKDQQIKRYAAWAVSFLRHRWWSKDFQNMNRPQSSLIDSKAASQSFSDDSLVWKLYLWLMNLQSSEIGATTHVNTIATVLRCLRKAPRLPVSSDWGPIIRRCMRHGAQFSGNLHIDEACKMLREECLNLSLAHASHIDPLLLFLDEHADLPRFRTLELHLQLSLLCQLSDLMKVFSSSRQEKLCNDFIEFFSSSTSPYLVYEPNQQCLLRISFWKGLHECLTQSSDSLAQNIEMCMGKLFSLLPVLTTDSCYGGDQATIKEEWSEAVQCLAKARMNWVLGMLQVAEVDQEHYRSLSVEDMKRIVATAGLVKTGHVSVSELGKLKALILNVRSQGNWNILIEVAEAVFRAEGSIRRQWLIDAIDICITSQSPSTALQFIGILAGSCCKYMPLLILDPVTVLRDLPVTLPSLLSERSWAVTVEPLVTKLWLATERICTWAAQIHGGDELLGTGHIDASEKCLCDLLPRVMRQTCISLRHYLPFEKQLKLANMFVSSE